MANEYLRTSRIPKGYAAEDVLKRFGWPKKTHQKIVNKYYNSKFKKLSPTADTVLTAPADFSWPNMDQNLVAIMTKNLKELQKQFTKFTKSISAYEKALRDNKNLADEQAAFLKEYSLHMRNAKKLTKRCVDDYRAPRKMTRLA